MVQARFIDRFWSRVDTSAGPDGCWLWTASCNAAGYGQYWLKEVGSDVPVRVLTHRLSLELKLGRPLSSGLLSLHRCDNPPCCNPEHLFEGGHRENFIDCMNKARCRGMRSKNFTPELVQELRSFYNAGGVSQRELCLRMNLSKGSMSKMLTGKSYFHIKPVKSLESA